MLVLVTAHWQVEGGEEEHRNGEEEEREGRGGAREGHGAVERGTALLVAPYGSGQGGRWAG